MENFAAMKPSLPTALAWQDLRGRLSTNVPAQALPGPGLSARPRAPPGPRPRLRAAAAPRGGERGRAAGAASRARPARSAAGRLVPAEDGGVPVPPGVRQVHSRAQQRCLRGRGGSAAGGGEPVRQSLGGRVRAGGVEKPTRAEPPGRRQGGCRLGVPGGHPQLLLLVRAGGVQVPCEVQGQNLQRLLVAVCRRQQGPGRRSVSAGAAGPGRGCGRGASGAERRVLNGGGASELGHALGKCCSLCR